MISRCRMLIWQATRCNADSAAQGWLPQPATTSFRIGTAQNRTDARLGWVSQGTVPVSVALYVNNFYGKQYATGVQDHQRDHPGNALQQHHRATRFYGVELGVRLLMDDAGSCCSCRRRSTRNVRCARVCPYPGCREQVVDLRTLQRFLLENREALIEAVSADYGNRSRHETSVRRDGAGARWSPACAQASATLDASAATRSGCAAGSLGRATRVLPQPLGVVGIVVPWNYPISLLFAPLTSVFAAGNLCRLVKMSENSRYLAGASDRAAAALLSGRQARGIR